MTKDQYASAIRKLVFDVKGDDESLELARFLADSFPNSSILDLIFQDMRNLTPEQVVEEAFQREAEHTRMTGSV